MKCVQRFSGALGPKHLARKIQTPPKMKAKGAAPIGSKKTDNDRVIKVAGSQSNTKIAFDTQKAWNKVEHKLMLHGASVKSHRLPFR